MSKKELRIVSSLHWLSLAINSNNSLDKILYLWTALEFILSESKLEKKFNKSDREEIMRKIVELYTKYLFSIRPNFKTDLETNKISEDLRKVFKDKEYPLSDDVKLLTVANNEWKIWDGEMEYVIRESDNQLNIYNLNNE